MAKSLHEYSTPVVANVPVGLAINIGTGNFELRTGLLTMVQANKLCASLSEDANAHLQNFLELCKTITIKDVAPDSVKLCLFPFSLSGKAKQWFYQSKEAVDTWNKCAAAFLIKFFPMSKTNALRGKISNFQQSSLESIREAWERLQEYIRACPHHGMEGWLVLQNFYEGLTAMCKGHIDAIAGGAFLSLTITQATALIEKMVANQSWGEGRKTQKGMRTVEETDLLAAKIDILMKRLEGRATAPATDTV
ncbi:uncharacterized protein LOC110435904 [Sorghum bicolor]|uniref:uncharacterized protein LOC110435904 n=1 Tax=Sorghum bicolor TaxID=4558 RepID=UPI000B423A53|nr:uncharacterized protein LOC110435904 [Sorghum bicolor]|eukprot:XP_021317681.1 uncharacterized protein LOC110435904 [Sorghum bicolor]